MESVKAYAALVDSFTMEAFETISINTPLFPSGKSQWLDPPFATEWLNAALASSLEGVSVREEEWATAESVCTPRWKILGQEIDSVPLAAQAHWLGKINSNFHLLSRQWTNQLVTCCVRGQTRRDELSPKTTQSVEGEAGAKSRCETRTHVGRRHTTVSLKIYESAWKN